MNLALRRADPAMLADVREGLARPQKELPPKYFYDHRGSLLFEAITRLPEYYPTRVERGLLQRTMPMLIERLDTRTLVELGAGNADKTRIILDAMRPADGGRTYVPVDVSAAFLDETARRLRSEYLLLRVAPVVADIVDPFITPAGHAAPVLQAFLGSTIGNFHHHAAVALLRRARRRMMPADRFLLGVDLRKDVAVIEAAYNDAQGVTAEFNRNMLRVLNHELGADFDPTAFDHCAFYERQQHRIEMHLVSRADQMVTVPGIGEIALRRGESIRTEISGKYDRQSVESLFTASGLQLEEWLTDRDQYFALVVGAPQR